MTQPTSPIELTGAVARLGAVAALPPGFGERIGAICATTTDVAATAEASRDWWPLAMHWSLAGQVLQRAALVARPTDTAQVAAVVAMCNDAGVPITAAGGRSGVLGASIPLFGGVLLDLTAMQGIVAVDTTSGVVEVLPGTFGPELETELRAGHGLTIGHFPQSFDIATVGGWVACRGAGQYSTRYGKIEQMVVGLEVVLANGSIVRTGGFPAGAQGPDLTQLFVGSEGTLGIITRVWLKAHPVPPTEQRAAYAFPTFEAGLEACRRILRRGATPAVLRLYDAVESQRGQGGDGSYCVLLVLDEGDELLVAATMQVVALECAAATVLPTELVEKWMHHRNDTSALQALTRKGFVVDTLEIAAPWSALPAIFAGVPAAMMAVPHARAATCHLSHSYLDGACLYFTFAATPPADEIETTYVALWDAGQRAVLAHGGNLSHHHGVGLNRARFVAEALGAAMPVLQSVKQALDPRGILNPGKMGLRTVFGEVEWP
ncbi:MAG: FAD-binding oxidoreductase [Ilumatobacteraceae bacterium]|nr:FAD-binding oxidoreductase [Acidimicrobiaceae bacterium]MBP6487663.1 FAD-binding oxidoreductase [Ilumatobacteraceae bacterium]MBP7890695.1 FAD-binding oxidoreductase [Ilumatobacteraceae bacterium]MBP8210902.1 FAD-binding oxidoreductase [Ilumatobacteraceae bacterium]HAN35749.1 FAD-binding oxidoreductase [Acidimicrobiaceae bacterium]